MRSANILLMLTIFGVCLSTGCGNIEGLSLPCVASPRVELQTPASPAEGNITISFQLTDREVEPADITVEYSTNAGTTYSTATLTIPGDATNLASAWHPGKTHTVTWNSVTDMVGRSGAVSVCIKITPSDASNPSGTPGISGSFTVNNIADNEAPTATTATPAGVQTGNVQINYFLADVESDTCSITVLYSTNGGTSYQTATMGPAGDGVSGLSSSPSGTAHMYLWDSRADNVAPSGQVDTIRIRITPTDFNAGTAGDTNSFSVDNSVANDPPTVAITGGPTDGSTVTTTQVTFTWSGSDTDGSVVGYYYSFDHDPPDVWTTDTTVTSGALSEASHTFRVVAVDDDSDLSAVTSRSFTVSIPGTITAQFSGSPLTGPAPLTVNFTDESSATNGITNWSWDFGDSETSTQEDPSHQYISAGNYTVSLTITGPDGTDTETKVNYISTSSLPDPTLVGSYDTASHALDVFVSGEYAYVADKAGGLQIINISNPASPTFTGSCDTSDEASGVYVSGSYAYVADKTSGLQIINISNPASPTLTGSNNTPDYSISVYVSDSYAYVADFAGGLYIINISNPASPAYAGSYDTPGFANFVYVSGSYAYVADGNTGLQIINISNPASPTLAGSYDTPGYARGVYVSGSYAYVADESTGLQIINISNPASPVLAGSCDTPGGARGVCISGSYAYVADYTEGLHIIDISNPASPSLAGSCDTPGYAYSVCVNGSYAYVADGDSGLQIIYFPNPAGSLVPPTNFSGVGTATSQIEWTWNDDVSPADAYLLEDDSGYIIAVIQRPASSYTETVSGENTPATRHLRSVVLSTTSLAVDENSTGTLIWPWTISGRHMQFLYTATELSNQAGSIRKVYWYRAYAGASQTYQDVAVLLGHTTNTELGTGFAANFTEGDSKEVRAASQYVVPVTAGNNEWVEIPISDTDTFYYNGSNNLVLDMNIASGTTDLRWTVNGSIGSNSALYAAPGAATGTPWDKKYLIKLDMDIVSSTSDPTVPPVTVYSLVHDATTSDFNMFAALFDVQVNVTPPPNPYAGMTGVKVERAENEAFTVNRVMLQDFTANYAVINTVPGAGTYWYRITYCNGNGVLSATSPGASIKIN